MRIFLAFIFLGLAEGVDFGWITPVHVADGKCFEASQRYIEAFGVAEDPRKNMTWGQYMLDADGRLPLEGFLSDTIPFPIPLCDLLAPALPNCTQLPSFLTNVVLNIPIGFSHNAGNMDLCLDEGIHTDLGVKTQYCSVAMLPPEIDTEGADTVTPGFRTQRSQSYFDKIANLLEAIHQMKQMDSLESGSGMNRTTINGFGQFQEHMKQVQTFSKAESEFTAQQVGSLLLLDTRFIFQLSDSRAFHGNLRSVEQAKYWNVFSC